MGATAAEALDTLNMAQALSNAGGASTAILPMLRGVQAALADSDAGAIALDRLALLLLQCDQLDEADALLRQRGYHRRLNRAVLCGHPERPVHAAHGPLASSLAVVENALPLPLLAALQAAFAPDAPFWVEHRYEHPATGFFSYVEPLPPPSERTRHSTLLGAVVRRIAEIAASRLSAASAACTAEWWAHWRPHRAGVPLHFDSASAHLAEGRPEADGMCTPLVSTVLYLHGGVGGRTLVTDQRWSSSELARTGALVSPAANRLLVFEGDLLHAVVPAATPPPAATGAMRTTLMVALWRRMTPVSCAQPPPAGSAGEGGPPAGLTGGMRLPETSSGWLWPRQLTASSGEGEEGVAESGGEGQVGRGGEALSDTAPVVWIRPVWERVGAASDVSDSEPARALPMCGKRERAELGPEGGQGQGEGEAVSLSAAEPCFQGITTWRRLAGL